MQEFISKLVEWDKELFLFLNGFHTDNFDSVMWLVSGKLEWIPLYLFLAFLLFKKFGNKIYIPLIVIGVTITLTDQLAVSLFKNVFERLRPCHDPSINELVHIVNNKCGGKYGFISNHAANSFGVATIIGLMLRSKYLLLFPLLLLWATIVSYSRVYLGVHFPADILVGAFFGSTIALLLYSVFLIVYDKWLKKAGKI